MLGFRGTRSAKSTFYRAKTNQVRPGDILFFYMSKDPQYAASQSITTFAIAEQVALANSTEELVHLTAKRSVFSAESAATPTLMLAGMPASPHQIAVLKPRAKKSTIIAASADSGFLTVGLASLGSQRSAECPSE